MISAHRGTARGTRYAENTIAGLDALINRGYLMSEIDVARLKDGTHILYHDGVWEDGSTGRGAVAAVDWEKAEGYLLKDTQGRLTSQTPPKLEDYLTHAQGRIYLEIDFKSSANYQQVIDMIRTKNMTNSVILIAYNEGQARTLSRLAPNMWISVSTQRSSDISKLGNEKLAAWLGKSLSDHTLIDRLEDMKTPILGSVGNEWSPDSALKADVLVTDYAFDHRPISGLTRSTRKTYENCLTEKSSKAP